MTFEITDLNKLDPNMVQLMLDSATTRLQELHPELDLKRGVFHDTVVYYHAMLETAIRMNLSRYLSARSLLEIENDPTLADDDVVDSVLSLYRVTRQLGTKASGQITVVVSQNTTVTVAAGSVWTANGQNLTTPRAYTGKQEPELIATSGDRLMVQLSDGNWAFQIDVNALEEGPGSKLVKDTKVIPNSQPANYLTAYATEDFDEGVSTQTNEELLQELQHGMAAKALSNRVNMSAMLLDIEGLSRIVGMSIVGFGDSEMLRDQHSIIPISYGGRVDWYVRGQEKLNHDVITKNAVLIEKKANGDSIWQVSIARTESPGFYEVRNIRLTSVDSTSVVGGFTITFEQRGLDLTDDGFIPDIQTQAEGEYSSFQTTVVQFRDTETDVSSVDLGSTRLYEFEAVGTTLIEDVQEVVSSRDVRSYAADALIKAPVPCFVRVNFTVNKRTADPDPDVDSIKSAIASVVNQVPFIGRLDASLICDVVHSYLSNSMSITGMDLFGRIRRPDGKSVYLRDPQSLKVSDDPANMVTSKTVQFFLEQDDIAVSVENTVPTPV